MLTKITIMEKKVYESLKKLRVRVASGAANFAERNLVNIINNKQRKGKRIHFNAKLRVKTIKTNS